VLIKIDHDDDYSSHTAMVPQPGIDQNMQYYLALLGQAYLSDSSYPLSPN